MTASRKSNIRRRLVHFSIGFLNFAFVAAAPGAVLFQSGANQNNFVPFGPSGTPNRPTPGSEIGTQITTGSADLTQITATFGTNNSTGNPVPQSDTYTLRLYDDNGTLDPNGSGLLGPGTLLFQTTVTATNSGGIYSVAFATPVSVPSTYIVTLLSSHPTGTFSSSAGLVGPLSASAPPTVGSALNTLWYSSNQSGGWETNSTWAMADGAATNYLSLKVEGSIISPVPEPTASLLLVLATGFFFGSRIWRNKGTPANQAV